MVAIAKEAGFSISADDLSKAQAELSVEELNAVVGGKPYLSTGGNPRGSSLPCMAL